MAVLQIHNSKEEPSHNGGIDGESLYQTKS